MNYTKHEFKPGEKLYAQQLNEMDEQIHENTEAIEKQKKIIKELPILEETYVDTADKLTLVVNIDELESNILYKASYDPHKIVIVKYILVCSDGSKKTVIAADNAFNIVQITRDDTQGFISLVFDNVVYKVNYGDKSTADVVTVEKLQNQKYLGINNSTEFIPTSDYQPVTKKYVDDECSRLSEDIADLKENGTGTGGISSALKTALTKYFTDMQSLFIQIAYGTDNNLSLSMIANAQSVVTALDGVEVEPDEPINPDEPEKTLSSISATYTGGNAPVGTAVTDLTGIVVIATYSDGSTAVVTGYTLSGEIVEGDNTITVSYCGMTATFTVTGYVESADQEWVVVREIGENYVVGQLDLTTGEFNESVTSFYTSDFIEVPDGATSFSRITSNTTDWWFSWYNSEKTFIGNGGSGTYSGTATYGGGYTDSEGVIWNVIPSEAKYCKVSWRTSATYTSVTFKHNLLLSENVQPIYNNVYYYNVDASSTSVDVYNVEYLNCEGMAYAQIRPVHRRKIEFYDADHSVVSAISTANNLGNNVAVPEGAKYMRFATVPKYSMAANNVTYSGYGLIEFTETELTEW